MANLKANVTLNMDGTLRRLLEEAEKVIDEKSAKIDALVAIIDTQVDKINELQKRLRLEQDNASALADEIDRLKEATP